MENNILSKVQPVGSTDDRVTTVIYGRAGSGKTTLAASFPKKILLLDVKDKGTDSIKDVEGIDVLEITDWTQFEEVYWALASQSHPYQTVVIDTITNLQELAIAGVKRRERLEADAGMSQRLWGDVSRVMQEWIYAYRDLPMHVVFLAQERFKRGSDDENFDDQLDPEVGPALMPSVQKTLCAAVKIVGNTFIKQTVKPSQTKPGQTITVTSYMLRVGPHPYYITKMRTPKTFKTPLAVRNATFESLKQLMKGEIQGAEKDA